jgi:hypothetical protein
MAEIRGSCPCCGCSASVRRACEAVKVPVQQQRKPGKRDAESADSLLNSRFLQKINQNSVPFTVNPAARRQSVVVCLFCLSVGFEQPTVQLRGRLENARGNDVAHRARCLLDCEALYQSRLRQAKARGPASLTPQQSKKSRGCACTRASCRAHTQATATT